jgi:DNA processing protein
MGLEAILDEITLSPYRELTAYEFLYSQDGASLRSMTKSTVLSHKLPSEVLRDRYGLIEPAGLAEVERFLGNKMGNFSIVVNNTPSYPMKLKASEHPTPLIYYRGDIGLLESKSISIVGARKASSEGLSRAARLAKELVERGYTIVSGLAAGIDTAALTSALALAGAVIGVIGTPIDEYYPKENRALQDTIAYEHLLVSQVPLLKYSQQSFKTKRFYFPERNELMAAISDATVIVEASDTSGTLIQARACLAQKRPLFILKSCADNPSITWPKKLLEKDSKSVFIVETSQQLVKLLEAFHA